MIGNSDHVVHIFPPPSIRLFFNAGPSVSSVSTSSTMIIGDPEVCPGPVGGINGGIGVGIGGAGEVESGTGAGIRELTACSTMPFMSR